MQVEDSNNNIQINMSGRASAWGPYNARNLLQLIHRYKGFSNVHGVGHASISIMAKKIEYGYSAQGGFQMIHTSGGRWKNLQTNSLKVKDDTVKPPAPEPPRFSISSWAKWILGSILSFLLPFLKLKWDKFKKIEGEAEIIAEEVETVANVVEKVATVAEHISADVAEKFPENEKLKKTAMMAEKVSKATAHDAELTKDFIHEVDVLKHDFEDLETMAEPVIEKLIPKKP